MIIETTVAPRLYIYWLCKDMVNARRALERAMDRPILNRDASLQRAEARIEHAMNKLREAFSVPEDKLKVVAGSMEISETPP